LVCSHEIQQINEEIAGMNVLRILDSMIDRYQSASSYQDAGHTIDRFTDRQYTGPNGETSRGSFSTLFRPPYFFRAEIIDNFESATLSHIVWCDNNEVRIKESGENKIERLGCPEKIFSPGGTDAFEVLFFAFGYLIGIEDAESRIIGELNFEHLGVVNVGSVPCHRLRRVANFPKITSVYEIDLWISVKESILGKARVNRIFSSPAFDSEMREFTEILYEHVVFNGRIPTSAFSSHGLKRPA
jgi:hypothetical protein